MDMCEITGRNVGSHIHAYTHWTTFPISMGSFQVTVVLLHTNAVKY